MMEIKKTEDGIWIIPFLELNQLYEVLDTKFDKWVVRQTINCAPGETMGQVTVDECDACYAELKRVEQAMEEHPNHFSDKDKKDAKAFLTEQVKILGYLFNELDTTVVRFYIENGRIKNDEV